MKTMHNKDTIGIEGKRKIYNQAKKKDSLWLTKEKNKITAGIYVKLNKSFSLYHCIRGFINTTQG